jgi:hypothetical protein
MCFVVTRLKAALVHLVISAVLASTVLGLLLLGWYRLPYFWAIGGLFLLTLIIGIDVILGPMMTLIIFNPAKSRRALTFDLTMIGLVQAMALAYGLYTGYSSRLAYGVFVDRSFKIVKANEIESQDLAKAKLTQYSSLPLFGPEFVGVQKPSDPKTRNDMNFYSAFGMGYQNLPEYYVPLKQNRDQISQASIPRGVVEENNPELAARIDGLLRERNLDWSGVAVVPLVVKGHVFTAIVDLTTVSVIKVLPENLIRSVSSHSKPA